jgi:hypothetical protein
MTGTKNKYNNFKRISCNSIKDGSRKKDNCTLKKIEKDKGLAIIIG